MNNSITITERKDGWAVKIPFELKNAFKEAFKSGRWDSRNKMWCVGTRSKSRLEQWVAEVNTSGIVAEIAEHDEILLAQEEITQLNKNIEAIREKIAVAQATKESLSDCETAISNAKTQLFKDTAKLNELNDSNKSRICEAIDMTAVLSARDAMAKVHKGVKSIQREAFEEARKVIADAAERLEESGIVVVGINRCLNAKFARPDRDFVGNIKDEEFYKIEDDR
jgi:hypothetical protein